MFGKANLLLSRPKSRSIVDDPDAKFQEVDPPAKDASSEKLPQQAKSNSQKQKKQKQQKPRPLTKLLLLNESFAVEESAASDPAGLNFDALPLTLPEKFRSFAKQHGAMPTTYPLVVDYG